MKPSTPPPTTTTDIRAASPARAPSQTGRGDAGLNTRRQAAQRTKTSPRGAITQAVRVLPGQPMAHHGVGLSLRSRRAGGVRRRTEGCEVQVLGIDIGGTGIKAAPVNTTKGTLLTERVKVETPHPAQPDAVAAVVAQHVKNFDWTGPVGLTFPGVVVNGVTMTAANLDRAWVGLDTRALFTKAAGVPISLINDADAAGLAEMKFGAGAWHQGTVLMLTFGTGIGSALFRDGT